MSLHCVKHKEILVEYKSFYDINILYKLNLLIIKCMLNFEIITYNLNEFILKYFNLEKTALKPIYNEY